MTSLWILIKGFSIIGVTAFGGGATMIKLIRETFVEKYNIIDAAEFASILGVTFLFPGLTGVKLAAIIGFKSSGILGALTAIIALNIPGIILALIGYAFILANKNTSFVSKGIIAMGFAAIAMLASALVDLIRPNISTGVSWVAILLTIILFVLVSFFNIPAILALIMFIISFVLFV
jgi:chromate transporter